MTNYRGETFLTPNDKFHIKDEPVTPIEEDFGDHNHLDCSYENEHPIRKSLSMNDIATLREDLMGLDLNNVQDVHQRYRRPAGAPQELSKTKFVSMAEAIYHYQRDTPGRFHSTRPQNFRRQGPTGPSGLTVPQSPMLRCKRRSRTHHILSQKEKEEREIEELKKFKIKANPIPKSVIEGSKNLPEVSKKPITIPEPFKLTEVHKRAAQSPDQVQFKARPAPRHILEKPHVPPKPPVQTTKPVSPKFHYKRSNSENLLKPLYNNMHNSKSPERQKKPQRLGPLHPEPFSFEKRDEELRKRKEERIKQQIEEERKQASQFKAQPLPGGIVKRMRSISAKGSASTTSSSSENKENFVRFEARPPAVLYKEPFKPVHKPLQLVKPVPFQLTTEKRAAERERFDKLLKEKEEEQEKYRKLKEKEQEEAQEKAQVELRSKLVHHAKPVPVAITNPFKPEKSVAPLTVPETPKFVRRLKQN